MGKTRNLLIIQSYNANKGDNSVIYNMLKSLAAYQYHIELTAFDAEKARKEYNIPTYPYLYDLYRAKRSKSRVKQMALVALETVNIVYLLTYALLNKTGIKLPLSKKNSQVANAYRKADLIVLPGGHFFTSFNSLITNFSHFAAMRFAQMLGKKTMVYSQTVGPFKPGIVGKIVKAMGTNVLKKTDVVTLREKDSLNSYNGKNVQVTAETVFLEPIDPDPINITSFVAISNRAVIGLTIHHIYFKHYYSREEYMRRMTEIINGITDTLNCALLIIPMEEKYDNAGDRPMIKELIAKANSPQYINTIDEDLTPNQTASLISQCTAFIGTKTHSIVYGLKTTTPTLAIAYQQKSAEFMEAFGVSEYCIPLSDITSDSITRMLKRLLDNKEDVKSTLTEALPRITEAANANNIILNELINE